MKQISAITLGLVAFSILFQINSASAEEFIYHGKNVVESPAEFAGSTFHFLINGDKATVVSAGMSGLEIVRMDLTPSEVCIAQASTLCFDGEVTDVKNPQMHAVGDLISLSIDFANKKQIGTAKSGPMNGMSVTMNIDRMSIQTDAPYTISISREGGFGGFAPKTMTFDSTGNVIVISEGDSTTNVPLEDSQVQQINELVQQSKLINIKTMDYPPVSGSADYFSYGMHLTQGVFGAEFSWTDTSENAPKVLGQLHQTIWSMAEENAPIPTEQMPDEEAIVDLAREFVLSSPTFAFDGMEDTLEMGAVIVLESFPEQYALEARFTSSHGGFGDRTDQVVTQVLTPHVMEIIISEGAVISAVTDGEWDELNNQFVLKAPN
jgi:hypothetical protein